MNDRTQGAQPMAGAGVDLADRTVAPPRNGWWKLLVVCACAIVSVGAMICARPAAAETPPDVLILVYSMPDGNDQVGLTYRALLTRAQAQRDLAALTAGTGWVPKHVVFSAKTAAQLNAETPMTSVSFDARDIIMPQTHIFPLEPIVSAMKAYPLTALTYLVATGHYGYQGLRQYEDRYVSIRLDEQTAAFTYHIRILDPTFQKLNLPLYQAPAAQSQVVSASPAHSRARSRFHSWLVGLIALVAIAAGGAVYFVASRQPWHAA